MQAKKDRRKKMKIRRDREREEVDAEKEKIEILSAESFRSDSSRDREVLDQVSCYSDQARKDRERSESARKRLTSIESKGGQLKKKRTFQESMQRHNRLILVEGPS